MVESVEEFPVEKQRWSYLDYRSLFLFRVGLGLTLLLDLMGRLPHIQEFYTDQGVLPRLVLVRSDFANQWLSLHLGIGHWEGEFILFLIQAVFAVAVILGWRTHWAVLGSWFLLNSLHARNPFVNDRGDLELVLLLFWGFFLPLGAKWSLDARAGRKSWSSNAGIPAAALLIQIAQIYLWAAFLKYGDFWLVRGDGLAYSLRSPLFATPVASWLSQAPSFFLLLLNYLVIAGEVFAGLLLLCPVNVWLMRKTALIILVGFHVSVLFLFRLGLFPLIGLVGLLALVPPDLWSTRAGRSLSDRLDRRVGSNFSKSHDVPWWVKGLLLLSVFLSVVSNSANRPEGEAFERPNWIKGLSSGLRLDQHWDLFSPIPPYMGVFTIERSSGQGSPVFVGPPGLEGTGGHSFPSHRWRMLMIASLYPRFAFLRPGLVRVLVPSGEDTEKWRYRFDVRLVGAKGELKPSTRWLLWEGVPSEYP
jgi:HTTM domain